MAGDSDYIAAGDQASNKAEDVGCDFMSAPTLSERRQSWARKSRELKQNPWKFASADKNGDEAETSPAEPADPNKVTDDAVSDSEDAEEFYYMSKERRCQCFLKVSLNIDSVDEIDGVCEDGKSECLSAVTFLQGVPADTRASVAKYLSTGNPEHLHSTRDNLHDIFHLAKILNLQQLYNQCMVFCASEIGDNVAGLFGGCECEEDIVKECKVGYQRYLSVVPCKDENAPPEFYIVFSKNGMMANEKKTVIVIDMSQKMDIFEKKIDHLQQLGVGSKCCSCYKKDSPYIFACGGKGKFAYALWKYDVLLGRWQKCAKMLHERFKHCLIANGRGSLFAIGGDKSAWIDEYKISTNKWIQRVPLEKHVSGAVCAIYNDKIYIFGGKTTSGPLATVQCYDIDTSLATCLPDLPCAFWNGQAVVYEDKIFIATRQGHMICFSPETLESHLCAQQPVQRDHFGMFFKNNRLYLVGGVTRDEEEESTPLYRYNPIRDTWTAEPGMCRSFPVYSSCTVTYPRFCPVVPFNDRL